MKMKKNNTYHTKRNIVVIPFFKGIEGEHICKPRTGSIKRFYNALAEKVPIIVAISPNCCYFPAERFFDSMYLELSTRLKNRKLEINTKMILAPTCDSLDYLPRKDSIFVPSYEGHLPSTDHSKDEGLDHMLDVLACNTPKELHETIRPRIFDKYLKKYDEIFSKYL